jgi:hypothetical protein
MSENFAQGHCGYEAQASPVTSIPVDIDPKDSTGTLSDVA